MNDKKKAPVFDRRSIFQALGRRTVAPAARAQGPVEKQHPVVKLSELVKQEPASIKKFLVRLGENYARRRG